MTKVSEAQLLKNLLDMIEANHETPHDNQRSCGICNLEVAILQEALESGLMDVEFKPKEK